MAGKYENEAILHEEADEIRKRLKIILFKKGCSHCGIQPSIREVASILEINHVGLNKFLNEDYGHQGMRRKNYGKVVEWLEKVE